MVQLGRGEAGQAVLEQLVEERAREQMRDGNRLPAQLAQDGGERDFARTDHVVHAA